jgi:hypothetical protein
MQLEVFDNDIAYLGGFDLSLDADNDAFIKQYIEPTAALASRFLIEDCDISSVLNIVTPTGIKTEVTFSIKGTEA